MREEVGMAVFYIAERLCYRVAFLLSGVCNRHLLAVVTGTTGTRLSRARFPVVFILVDKSDGAEH